MSSLEYFLPKRFEDTLMFGKYVFAIVSLLIAGCAGTPPVFAPAVRGTTGVENHVIFKDTTVGKFEFKSYARTISAAAADAKNIEWKPIAKVDELPLRVVLLSEMGQSANATPNLENSRIAAGEFGPNINISSFSHSIAAASKVLSSIFGAPLPIADVRLHIIAYGKDMLTFETEWQSGPPDGGFKLNLGLMLPDAEAGTSITDRERSEKIESDVAALLAHEYSHVAIRSRFSPMLPALADEFVAHTIDRCARIEAIGLTNPRLLAGARATGVQFRENPNSLFSGIPFAISTTGGSLASAAFAVFLSRPEFQDLEVEQLQESAQQYCKFVFSSQPTFGSTLEAIAWIQNAIQLPQSLSLPPRR